MTDPSKSNNSVPISRFLRPDRFDSDPTDTSAEIRWAHWIYTFKNFLIREAGENELSDDLKLQLLVNHLSPTNFLLIRDCKTFDQAILTLQNTYNKPKNEIHARFILSSRKQEQNESISEYLRTLKVLAHDCKFKAITAEENESEYIRDAFIAGITNKNIRQRLLENFTLTLEETENKAIAMETAEINTLAYKPSQSNLHVNAMGQNTSHFTSQAKSQRSQRRCFFCGSNTLHQRPKCPAFNAICQLCSKKGHFANVCRGSQHVNSITTDELTETNTISTISAASPSSLQKATIRVTVNNNPADALIDTGSSVSFIDNNLAKKLNLKLNTCKQAITLASLSYISFVSGSCAVTLKIGDHTYKEQKLLIIENLCADLIIGHDVLKYHKFLEFNFGGTRDTLKVCVMQASVPPALLFTHLSPNIMPIAIKSRKFSGEDQSFIRNEISNLLQDGVIEKSTSPWRAQVLITGGTNHRKRLVIDYSLTINKFTELDAYPLPNIETLVAKVAKNNFFSQIDLKSAYHQIPIPLRDRKYTAFEADGSLYQFTRIPFGVTNGVAAFQRTLQYIIDTENLTGTFSYLDDVTVCGKDKADHDRNLAKFMKAKDKYGLTLNEQKCSFATNRINLLGYTIENNQVKPDEDRLKPLIELPLPADTTSLKRTLGMLAHYSKWIKNFSAKIKPLTNITQLPLTNEAKTRFEEIKAEIAKSTLSAVDDNATFTIETDASDYAIAATLSQNGRPVAFFSRALNDSERKHPAIEKEACAIVESLRKWRHYITGRHFILITDQQSVSFMFDQTHSSKIKNEKIERWRLELSCYKYDIIYRPGRENTVADALSRVCANADPNRLYDLHDRLCHPGITRMVHWVRSKNLPFSIEEIKAMTLSCRICAEIKPRFCKSEGRLIKAMSPMERLNIDFKGPLPSNTQNKYILTVIDEFSRFPFAFPCKDLHASTVIKHLKEIFHMFGFPLYIHSDRGASLISEELRNFLTSSGISCSRTTSYNPQGNGQVERLNGTLWRSLQLHLRSKNVEISNWEQALTIALHSIRSLLCTATNETPHERMFRHPRRSPSGDSIPTWLLNPGPVLRKVNVRSSKYDPLVEEAELLEANPNYSYIRTADGRETTVSNRQLAPLPPRCDDVSDYEDAEDRPLPENPTDDNSTTLRRSSRVRRAPGNLQDYDCS